MKAADIPDALFLEGIDELMGENRLAVRRTDIEAWLSERMGVEVPWKVTLAKARKLIKQHRLVGCACGCSGMYELAKKVVHGWMDVATSYDVGYHNPLEFIVERVNKFIEQKHLNHNGVLFVNGEFPKASLRWTYVPDDPA